jgi:hypothetical protein
VEPLHRLRTGPPLRWSIARCLNWMHCQVEGAGGHDLPCA